MSAHIMIGWRKQILFKALTLLALYCFSVSPQPVQLMVLEAFFPLIKRPLFFPRSSLWIFCQADAVQISKVTVLRISMSKEEFLHRLSFLSGPASVKAVLTRALNQFIYIYSAVMALAHML